MVLEQHSIYHQDTTVPLCCSFLLILFLSSSMDSLWAVWLLYHGPHSPPPHLFFFPFWSWCFLCCFSYIFVPSSLFSIFCLSKYIFPALLVCSATPYGGSTGNGCVFSQRPHLHPCANSQHFSKDTRCTTDSVLCLCFLKTLQSLRRQIEKPGFQ